MTKTRIYHILTYGIAAIWVANGLFCKVLNLVPRHEQIVARIVSNEYARPLTILIGISEILMACWILSRYKTKLNAIVQITVIATMNVIEFLLTPDLLLWGRWNALWAFLLMIVIAYHEFYLHKKTL